MSIAFVSTVDPSSLVVRVGVSVAGNESIVYIDFVDSNSKTRTESWNSDLTEYQERPMLRRSKWTIDPEN